jgi:hypothetical protein
MTLRTYLCKWDYIPHPAKPTIQIGWLFIGTHFPGVRCWGIEISSTGGMACFSALSRQKILCLGTGWKNIPLREVIFSRWRCIIIRLGEYLITLGLTQSFAQRQMHEMDRADTSLR